MTQLLHWLEEARRRGLIGPEPLERTLEHSRALGRVAQAAQPSPAVCLDLGSGGGVPGLILATDWPLSRWVLLDSNQRSGEFLSEAVEGLCLAERVTVILDRVEAVGRDEAHRKKYSLVTARAIAAAAVVAEYVAPLLNSEGVAVISQPPGARLSRWDEQGLAQLGLGIESHPVDPVAAAVLRRTGDVPDRFPRRTGVARKRPLWG